MKSDAQRKKVLLIVLDGVGSAPENQGNAVSLASPPNLIRLWEANSHTYLKASSEAVGLPSNTRGNSEVGHMALGSGRLILQNLPKINKAIENERFFSNAALLETINHVTRTGGDIHLLGCLTDGGVHAHINHLIALVEFYFRKGYKGNLYLHLFTDGRDSPVDKSSEYLGILQDKLNSYGIGQVASLCGRAYGMDRNETWDRTRKAYQLLTKGEGELADNWSDGIRNAYARGETDEYILPTAIKVDGKIAVIKNGDAVINFNFRSDRAIQITDALIDPEFTGFPVEIFDNLLYVGMVEYRREYPELVLFPKEYINVSLGRILSESGLKQLRIAESEKFPHVTYFFNGGLPITYTGEDRIEIPSPNVATYDLKPEMSAYEIRDLLLSKFKEDRYDFILVNFANGDMVGHTGNIPACIEAVSVVDSCVDELVKSFVGMGGTVIITADHGNVEEVINLKTGEVDTEHSLNPVPFLLINQDTQNHRLKLGSLVDVAPTILKLFNLSQPTEMTGESLI